MKQPDWDKVGKGREASYTYFDVTTDKEYWIIAKPFAKSGWVLYVKAWGETSVVRTFTSVKKAKQFVASIS